MNEFKIKFGTFTGAAAAQNLDLGFVPDYFRWWVNETTVEADVQAGEWDSGMTDADAHIDVAIDGSTADAAYSSKFITTGGISKLDTTVQQPALWKASTTYAVGDIVRPSTNNGYYYKCSVAGASDSTEPTWGTTPAGTTTDNAATWVCYKQGDLPVQRTKLQGVTIGTSAATDGTAYRYMALRGN